MTYRSTCPECGERLYRDDVHCPRCGSRRPDSVLASAPPRGATRAMMASSVAGEGGAPTCPSCGAVRLRSDAFCAACGATTSGERDAPGGAEDTATPPRSFGDPGRPPPEAPEARKAFDGWQEVRLQLEEATRGEFEIVKELGRGGMAAVYLARDLALGRNVAIKVMAPGLLMGPGMVERFRQEAVTVANLLHPNIVTIHTVREEGNLHFFVMQVVEGGSLEDILRRPEPIPIYLIQVILYQLGVGLSYAHRRGVIHRDIKPANVLLDQEGNAVLTDFGIAKVTTASHLTQTGSTIGTPAYMSPEQCRAKELTGASDQYALGVVAYEMLTGHPPFSGSPFDIMQAHTSTDPRGIVQQRSECPVELEAAVFRMLAKDPEDRFSDVAEAIEALGGYLPGPQDPIRADLVRLVTADQALPLSHRAPLKPTPGRASTPIPPTREDAGTPATGRGLRRLLWIGGATIAAAIAIFGGLYLLPSLREAPVPAAPQATGVSGILFPNAEEEILVGTTLRVTATFQDSQGQPTSGEGALWSSSDPGIATVEGFDEEAVVSGVSPGSASIVASLGGLEEGFQIRVSAPAASELALSAPRREVQVGDQLALSAILTDETGARVADPDISWRSSDPGILSVDQESGIATGRDVGRARVTAVAGDQSSSLTLTVVGRVQAIAIAPPTGQTRAGSEVVLRAGVTASPVRYRGPGGIAWSTSNPAVAAVRSAGADSVVLSLLQEGEAVVTARAGDVEGSVAIQVSSPAPTVGVTLTPASLSFQAVEGGASPSSQDVGLTISGDETPTVGPVRYEGAVSGWLHTSLGPMSAGNATVTITANATDLAEGSYAAEVPIRVGEEERTVEVRLTVAPNPAEGPVQPTDAAAREITSLLSDYTDAINTKDVSRVREVFPSLPQDAIDDLLEIQDTDTYYLQLTGALRLGAREGTLEGDVMSGVLGRDNRGQLVRMIYTFGRGQRGWYIVSLRSGG